MIKLGAKYRLVKHTSQPVCTVLDYNPFTQMVTIAWDDPRLKPPLEHYDEKLFLDGTFVSLETSNAPIIKGGETSCFHAWETYNGFNETYEYCRRCDAKRFKQ